MNVPSSSASDPLVHDSARTRWGARSSARFPRRGEIWWVRAPASSDGEIVGTRPAVVVSNDDANRYLNRVTIVPTTTNVQYVYPSEVVVLVEGTPSKACVDQIRTVAKRKLMRVAGSLSQTERMALDLAIRIHLGLD